jgi:hypothetical protein
VPNSSVTKTLIIGREVKSFSVKKDTSSMKNAAWITGSIGEGQQVNGWFTDATSIATYGRIDGTLNLPCLTNATEIARAATNLLIRTAFPLNKCTIEVYPARLDIDLWDRIQVRGFSDGSTFEENVVSIKYTLDGEGLKQTIELGATQPSLADVFVGQAKAGAQRETSLDKGRYQQPTALGLTDTGIPDAIETALNKAPASYYTGFEMTIVPGADNTGACTIDASSLGVKSIKMPDGTDPPAGALKANVASRLQYDGTNFVLASIPGSGATPAAHHTSHENGGSDEISVTGLSGALADKQDANKLQGRDLSAAAPSDNDVLSWDSASSSWLPEASSPGVTDHGALTGLGDDDHTQYHNDTRGDARYYTQTQLQTSGQSSVHWDNITNEPATYPPSSHNHAATDINSGTLSTDRFSAYDDLTAETKIGTGALQVAAGNHDHSGTYAPAANGVTNGDTHDHNGGDGAQIDHVNLANKGTNTHAQIDTHLGSTSNPHSTTASQVGLGNVTNEAQIAKSIGTTKGDLIAFTASATPARLGVGTDGQVPIADSAQASGMRWGNTEAMQVTITQAGHGFAAKNWVKMTGSATYAKAQADSAANADAMGMVVSVSGDDFTLALPGSYVEGLTGLTANMMYYLDPSTAGAMTTTAPTTVGQVWLPVFHAETTTTGYVLALVGQVIGSGAHASTHQSGGSDAIKLDDFAAPDDNTDLNASTSAHGLLMKLDNDATHCLDGQGNWVVFTRKNMLINPCALINQRVNAYTLVKDAYGVGPDRWYGMATGTAVSAGTLTRTLSASAGYCSAAFKFSGVTITGTGIIYFRYRMESLEALLFRNQTASFSCRVHQDTGGAINYTVYIRKANVTDDFSAVTEISNSGAISVSSGVDTALKYEGIALGECTKGIEIEIKIECGAITTKNFEFTELQFEIGTKAISFEQRNISDDLERCRRYYQVIEIAPGICANTVLVDLTVALIPAMRITPASPGCTGVLTVVYSPTGSFTQSATGIGWLSTFYSANGGIVRLQNFTGLPTASYVALYPGSNLITMEAEL